MVTLLYKRPSCRLLLVLLLAAGTCPAQSLPAAPAAPDLQAAARLLQQKRYADAEAALRAALAQADNDAQAHAMLAYALFREDKAAASLAEYTRVAHLQTPSAADLKWVALDYVLLNDYSDAARWMQRSLDMNPRDAQAWYSLGRIQQTRNRFSDAIHCFGQALALSPKDVLAEDNLGLAYEGLYQPEQAAAAYRTAIAWESEGGTQTAEPYINLGKLLLDGNHAAEAMPLLARAAALAPDETRVLTQQARANLLLGNLPAAEDELRHAVTAKPQDPALHFQLGRVLQKEGNTADAKVQFAAAESLNGTHSSPQR